MEERTYFQLMVESTNYIELKIKLKKPAELADFVSSFTALASQFEEYIKSEHPNLVDDETKIYVKQVKEGSIIADLVPFIQPMIENLDRAIIVDGFIKKYGGILKQYALGKKDDRSKKSDLNDFMGQVAAIAKDPNGSITISSAEYEATKIKIRATLKFNSKESKDIEMAAIGHMKQLEAKAYEVKKNVLLVFWQSNLKNVTTGKRSGEKAIIEDVTAIPLAVVYDSEIAEEKIKHETKDGERNLYKLGFYVTCRVERLNDKPVAYRISDVHSIIELPD